jgi:flagellar basal-body rod modification protein FlgD
MSTWAAIAGVQSPADASSAKLITAIGQFSPSDAKRLS